MRKWRILKNTREKSKFKTLVFCKYDKLEYFKYECRVRQETQVLDIGEELNLNAWFDNDEYHSKILNR